MDLVWTKDKPTKLGWYWFRFGTDGFAFVVRVAYWVLGGDTLYVYDHYGNRLPLSDSYWRGLWAGPIPEPKETPWSR